MGYYDFIGKLMNVGFLRVLVKYVCIFFYYNFNCLYLVLKYCCLYFGIDYVVFYGMLIIVVGNGVVICVGYMKGNGNFVKICYNEMYEI